MFWSKARTIKALKAELNKEMIRADAMEKMRDTARSYLAKADLKIVDLASDRDQFAKRLEDVERETQEVIGRLHVTIKEREDYIARLTPPFTQPSTEVLEDHLPDPPV